MKPYTPSTPTRLFGKIAQGPMTGPGFPAVKGKSIDEIAKLGGPLFGNSTKKIAWVGFGVFCIATGIYIIFKNQIRSMIDPG